MKRITTAIVVLSAMSALPQQATAEPGDLLLRIANPAPSPNDHFGYSVASLGSDLLVAESGTGRAYLLDGVTGDLLQTFFYPSGLGTSIAGSDDTVLLGAKTHQAAYLFEGSTGVLLKTLPNPTPAANDFFGRSVAILGNQLIVGAPFDDTGAFNAGSAYLFNAQTGDLIRTLQAPLPSATDNFGKALAAVDTGTRSYLLVGAPFANGAYPDGEGAAYLLDLSGNLIAKFENPLHGSGDKFGDVVAASGDKILIGAPATDGAASNSGAAHLFDADSGELLHTLLDPTPGPGEFFGRSVAAFGEDWLVGSYRDNAAGEHGGAVYLFSGTSGELFHTFANPNLSFEVDFGRSIARVGNNILIGAPGERVEGEYAAGAVYLFEGPVVPEQSTLVLFGAAAPWVFWLVWRRRSSGRASATPLCAGGGRT